LEEIVAFHSRSTICLTAECRNHDEVKNLAMCKAAKLASLLTEKRKISYLETTFQGRSKTEWTKFTFIINDPITENDDQSIVKFGVKYVRLISK
jgi:hypothetical protein